MAQGAVDWLDVHQRLGNSALNSYKQLSFILPSM
jgi:hypothetical protein